MDCKKKKEAQNNKKEGVLKLEKDLHNKKQILTTLDSSNPVTYQLDTGADYHVSSNENDFHCYSVHSQIVCVAGGGSISTLGSGNIFFPTSDGNTKKLHGAIHISSEPIRIISTSQLKKQGFSIRWLPQNITI